MTPAIGLSDQYEYFEMQFDSLDTKNTPDGRAETTDWPLFYLGRPLTEVAGIKIIETQIPFSYYVFNSLNNTFLLYVEGICLNAVVTIPVGNYSATTIVTMLKTQLDAALLSQGSPTPFRFTVTLSGATSSPQTGKITISLNSSSNIAMILGFGVTGDPGNYNPRLYLGFNAGGNVATYVPGTGMVLEAPNVNLISGPNYLYINSRKIGQLVNTYLPAGAANLGNGNSGPQLAKIPVNVQPGGIIFWSDPDPEKYFDLENLVNFADVDFYLSLGNTSTQIPLQLNGLSFSIKMGILVNKTVRNELQGGTAAANRVYARYSVR